MLIDLMVSGHIAQQLDLPPDFFAKSVVYDIQNIFNWHIAHRAGDDTRQAINLLDEIPNVAPLNPAAWFEFTVTQKEGTVIVGVQVDAIDFHNTAITTLLNPDILKDAQDRGVRWSLILTTFQRRITPHNDYIKYCRARMKISVNPYGAITGFSLSRAKTHDLYGDGELVSIIDGSIEAYPFEQFCFYLALTAICFAHCKGAAIHTTGPTRNDRRRAARKATKTAPDRAALPISFHTIDIRPITRIIRDADAAPSGAHGVKWHLVRGHFSTYTPDSPLFGKHVGTYYFSQHTRGTLREGAVIKRYRSHPEGMPAPTPAGPIPTPATANE
jgi:hypothetical protein